MNLLGDHASYILLMVFGLFAVGVHAYSSFGQQIPGNSHHQGNTLIDSLSVLSLGGQYSVFRGFVFYLLVSESLYIILTSSSMILQLSLNAIGREDMAGALSSGIELNPLIPILASSVIISASQFKPLSNVEQSIRRIGHRIAGIPRNVYEIQERIKSTSLSALKRQSFDSTPGLQKESRQISPLIEQARQSREFANQMAASTRPVTLRTSQRQAFRKSLQNVYLLHELSKLSSLGIDTSIEDHAEAQLTATDYLNRLDKLQLQTETGNAESIDNLRGQWTAEILQCHEIESQLISGLCELLSTAPHIQATTVPSKNSMNQAMRRIAGILQQREQTSTNPFERTSVTQTLKNIYLMRNMISHLNVDRCKFYREPIVECIYNLEMREQEFDDCVDTMTGDKDLPESRGKKLGESEWTDFFASCQRLESDLVTVLMLVFVDRVEEHEVNRLRTSSKIASYAESKAAVFVEASAALEISTFRLEGFQRSLEKVFCLYEWTLGTDGSQIWATKDTQQITLLFESIKHKFDSFENDLNSLLDELDDPIQLKKKNSIKTHWKEAIKLCGSLEDDLSLLLALLLINKPDAPLKNYALLNRLRDQVLERERNHEMNAFGMSALFGLFVSLTALTMHFYIVDVAKGYLRIPDSAASGTVYEVSALGPAHKDYEISEKTGLLNTVFGQILTEGGVHRAQREEFQSRTLDLIRSTTDSFLKACLEVLDFLIIFLVSTSIALTIRSMRKVERRWATREQIDPPPMYSYIFVGLVAYIVSACLILLYRFTRIVLIPMLDSGTSLLSSAHLSLFRESFAEYLLFPVTAFVIVWYVLEHMDHEKSPRLAKAILPALKFSVLCTLINVVGKMLSDAYKTGWDVFYFMSIPTIGFFSFMIMFAFCVQRYRIRDEESGKNRQILDIDKFFDIRDFVSIEESRFERTAEKTTRHARKKHREKA